MDTGFLSQVLSFLTEGKLMEYAGMAFASVASVVGVFALVATATPNKADNKVVSALWSVVNFLGANWGMAKNADDWETVKARVEALEAKS